MSIRAGRPSDASEIASLEGAAAIDAVEAFLRRATEIVARHEALLDRLDVALGDGDHGTNMTLGLRSVVRSLDDLPASERPADVGALLRHIGHGLVGSVGGASGPLYGTAFIEAGFFLAGSEHVDPEVVADAFEVGARALARRGRCAVGDKTILDALDGAASALRAAADRGQPLPIALHAAVRGAAAGMRATIPLVARRGLALRLGERSRGHRDPGATSCFLLVVALASAVDRGPR